MRTGRRVQAEQEAGGEEWIWGNHRGGGGAPLKDVDGSQVSNLRNVLKGSVQIDHSPHSKHKLRGSGYGDEDDYNYDDNRGDRDAVRRDSGRYHSPIRGLESHYTGRDQPSPGKPKNLREINVTDTERQEKARREQEYQAALRQQIEENRRKKEAEKQEMERIKKKELDEYLASQSKGSKPAGHDARKSSDNYDHGAAAAVDSHGDGYGAKKGSHRQPRGGRSVDSDRNRRNDSDGDGNYYAEEEDYSARESHGVRQSRPAPRNENYRSRDADRGSGANDDDGSDYYNDRQQHRRAGGPKSNARGNGARDSYEGDSDRDAEENYGSKGRRGRGGAGDDDGSSGGVGKSGRVGAVGGVGGNVASQRNGGANRRSRADDDRYNPDGDYDGGARGDGGRDRDRRNNDKWVSREAYDELADICDSLKQKQMELEDQLLQQAALIQELRGDRKGDRRSLAGQVEQHDNPISNKAKAKNALQRAGEAVGLGGNELRSQSVHSRLRGGVSQQDKATAAAAAGAGNAVRGARAGGVSGKEPSGKEKVVGAPGGARRPSSMPDYGNAAKRVAGRHESAGGAAKEKPGQVKPAAVAKGENRGSSNARNRGAAQGASPIKPPNAGGGGGGGGVSGFKKLQQGIKGGPVVVTYEEEGADGNRHGASSVSELRAESQHLAMRSKYYDVIGEDQLDKLLVKATKVRS